MGELVTGPWTGPPVKQPPPTPPRSGWWQGLDSGELLVRCRFGAKHFAPVPPKHPPRGAAASRLWVIPARSPNPDRITLAVRYALGRSSYLPALVADEVRRCWPQLGNQRATITEEVRRWLYDTQPDPWQNVDVWNDLYDWITEQGETE